MVTAIQALPVRKPENPSYVQPVVDAYGNTFSFQIFAGNICRWVSQFATSDQHRINAAAASKSLSDYHEVHLAAKASHSLAQKIGEGVAGMQSGTAQAGPQKSLQSITSKTGNFSTSLLLTIRNIARVLLFANKKGVFSLRFGSHDLRSGVSLIRDVGNIGLSSTALAARVDKVVQEKAGFTLDTFMDIFSGFKQMFFGIIGLLSASTIIHPTATLAINTTCNCYSLGKTIIQGGQVDKVQKARAVCRSLGLKEICQTDF